MIKSESLAKLAPALVKAQKNMGVALKDSKNPFFKSKYADLNAIIDAAIPALNDQGIAVVQAPQIVDGKAVIQTILLHESGEYLAGNSEVVASKQNDPQAAGSATTYARRYGLQAMATLKAEDDDAESAMGRKSIDVAKVPTPTPEPKPGISTNSLEAAASTSVVATGKKGGWAKPKTETKTSGGLF